MRAPSSRRMAASEPSTRSSPSRIASSSAALVSSVGCSSTISMMPRRFSKPSGLGGWQSGSLRWMSGSRATIWWSASVLTRTPAGLSVQVTVRLAPMLPRLSVAETCSRTRGSSASKPAGNRERTSSPLPLTLRTSQVHEHPAAWPTDRAKPVIDEIATNLSSGRMHSR